MTVQHHSLAITPLSPVHMGTGDDYEPTNYVIDEGALFEFDGVAALRSLAADERRRLDRILSGKPNAEMLLQVQAFFHNNREAMIASSRRQVRVNPSVEAFYHKRVGKVAQHEHGGGREHHQLEIERTAWNPVSGSPILPGSGLKGAIRTALLDAENAGQPLRDRRESNRDLQNRLFGYRADKFELDPLRLVSLGDCAPAADRELATRVWFAVNRKKRPMEKDGQLVASQAEQQGLYQLLECLPHLHARAFEGALSIQKLDPVTDQNKTPRLRFTVEEIADACNRFYRPILEAELRLLRQRGYVDAAWAQRIENLLERFAPRFEQRRTFLLRAGRHSGAESVTLKGVRNIRIMRGRGEAPEWRDSAKTVWLASRERQAQRGLLPFGWLLVEVDADGDDLWQGLEASDDDREWLAGVRARMARLAEHQARLRAEREERQRRQAEEDAARKAEEEARARMPPEQRLLVDVRTTYEQEKAAGALQGGCRTAEQRVKLLNEAEGWESAELRAEAAELIETITQDLPWSKKAKKQGVPGRVAKLRG